MLKIRPTLSVKAEKYQTAETFYSRTDQYFAINMIFMKPVVEITQNNIRHAQEILSKYPPI